MAKLMELSSLIHGKYNSESQLARDLGWSRQRLNMLTNGRKEPDLDEAIALADKLDVSLDVIASIFCR